MLGELSVRVYALQPEAFDRSHPSPTVCNPMPILSRLSQTRTLGVVVGGKGVGGIAIDDIRVLERIAPRIPDHT